MLENSQTISNLQQMLFSIGLDKKHSNFLCLAIWR